MGYFQLLTIMNKYTVNIYVYIIISLRKIPRKNFCIIYIYKKLPNSFPNWLNHFQTSWALFTLAAKFILMQFKRILIFKFENINEIKSLILFFFFLQSKKIQAQLKELRYGKKDLLFKVSIFLPTPSNWLAQYLNYLKYHLA